MKAKTISELKSAVWFLIKLNVLAIPLYLIVYFGYSVPALQDVWAAGLEQSLRSLGYETALGGNLIGVKSGEAIYQIDLSWDSTGWKSMYALSALVFASGVGTLRSKLRFLAFGIPLVVFANLLRVVTTVAFSLSFGFAWFDFLHTFLWGGLMIALVVLMWYGLFLKGWNKN